MRRRAAALAAVLLLTACGGPGHTGRTGPTRTPATARAAVRPQPFGLSWNAYDTPARYDPIIDGYRGGGTFHDITWCAVEPRRGEFHWDLEDRAVGFALAHGYQVLVRIHIGTCWASGRPATATPRTSPSLPPADMAAYGSFVRTLVARYAARGVHEYAIENEIDALNYWGADPAAYAPVARAGAAAVRQADPSARVTDPGLSSSSYGLAVAHATGSAAFYQAFYARRPGGRLPAAADAAGLAAAASTDQGRRILAAHSTVLALDAARVFDVYQLHYYDPWAEAAGVLDYIRARIAPGMPIEAWEAGSFWPGSGYDPDAHAAETLRLVATLMSHGVRRVTYLPLFYQPGKVAPEERWRALYAADGSTRPAAVAYHSLLTAGSTGTWRPLDVPGLAGAIVDRGGSAAVVAWSADGRTRVLTAPPGSGATATLAPSLPPSPWRSGSVTLGANPVVLTSPLPAAATLTWLNGRISGASGQGAPGARPSLAGSSLALLTSSVQTGRRHD